MPPEHLFRRLLGAYLAGAVEFEVVQSTGIAPVARGVIRTFVRRTIQPEVVSEEPDRVLLQDVSDASPVPLLKLLGRMGQVVLELQRDAARSWSHLTVGGLPGWESRDDEVDRQAWFIERSAVRALEADELPEGGSIGPLGCWTVARSLERIADHAVKMGVAGARLAEGPALRPLLIPLEQFHTEALRHLESVLEALAEDSGSRANELLDTGEALHEVARTLSERLFPLHGNPSLAPPSSAIALGRILESIDRTVAYAQDIAQVALDRGLPAPAVGSPARPVPSATAPGSPVTTEQRKTTGGTRIG
jgi:phosphate uptake regulator